MLIGTSAPGPSRPPNVGGAHHSSHKGDRDQRTQNAIHRPHLRRDQTRISFWIPFLAAGWFWVGVWYAHGATSVGSTSESFMKRSTIPKDLGMPCVRQMTAGRGGWAGSFSLLRASTILCQLNPFSLVRRAFPGRVPGHSPFPDTLRRLTLPGEFTRRQARRMRLKCVSRT